MKRCAALLLFLCVLTVPAYSQGVRPRTYRTDLISYFAPQPAPQVVFNPACPAGSVSYLPLQSYNQLTNQYAQNWCVDKQGRVYLNCYEINGNSCSGGGGGGGTVSGQASGVIPLATAATAIGAQSHLRDNGTIVSSTEILNSLTSGTFTLGAGAGLGNLFSVTTGSACPTTTFLGTTTITSGLTGCVVTPASGVTNGFVVGVNGYAQANDPGAGGQFGSVEAVGVYPVAVCSANNTVCIAVAPQVGGYSSMETGVVLEGEEVAVLPRATSDTGSGILLSFEGGNVQPVASTDNMPAIKIQSPGGTATFTTGFDCADGSIADFYCQEIGKLSATGASGSQFAIWKANTGSADIVGKMNFDQSGKFNLFGPTVLGSLSQTVGALPAASSVPGAQETVYDSTTVSAEGQTCVGSGAVTALAFSNGTIWKCF